MAQSGMPLVSYKLLNAPGLISLPLREARARYPIEAALGTANALGLEPYGLVVENKTTKHIIAYVLRVTIVDERGVTRIKERIFHNFNLEPGGGVAANGMEIRPGTAQIVTPTVSIRIAPAPSNPPGQVKTGFARSTDNMLKELAAQKGAVVSLDLVVFESGRVVGPDEGEVMSFVQAHFAVEKELAGLVHQELRAAKTMPEITDLLNQMASLSPRPRLPGAAAQHWRDFVTLDLSRFYLYKARISRDELVNTVATTLRKPSLILHR